MTRTGEGTTFHGLSAGGPTAARAYGVVYHHDRSWHVDVRPGETVEIGRSRSCRIHLEDRKASRLHATLSWDGTVLLLSDLGSTNGTLVNGKRVGRSGGRGSRELRSGDEIVVGDAVIVVGLTAPAAGSGRRVLAHADFEDRLSEEVARAHRYHRSAGLLMVRTPAGAGADLGEIVREMDIVGAYAPGELEVLVPEAGPSDAMSVARRIAGAWPGARVGLAVLPADGADRESLVSAARAALRSATEASPVVPARAGAGDQEIEPVANDPAMLRVLALVDRVASRDIAVLITGETGCGKEVVAREIHRRGRGRDTPFVAVNCAALPETIVDSELFGHEKGAFTGATGRKKGLFEAANGGTLFLDEVGELGTATQARLLRVLERREVLRVGATDPIAIDVRVIGATHRDLEREVRRGAFREDLLFRLNAFVIVVPPLRDRPEDLRTLCERFLAEAAESLGRRRPRLTTRAREALERHLWPGNIRQLKNAIERAVLLAEGDEIDATDLTDRSGPAAGGPSDGRSQLRDSVDALERDAIVRALQSCAGNQTRAAALLGVSRRALIYKMEKYGLKPRPA